MAWRGFDPKWLAQRKRHAAKPDAGQVSAAIDFYRPAGTPAVALDGLEVIDEGAKPAKHGNVVDFRGALRFDSKKEARLWDSLLMQQRAGIYDVVQRQVTFTFTVNGVSVGRYRADFVVREPGQRHLRVADCKSAHSRTLSGWSRTKALMRSCYGIEVEEW